MNPSLRANLLETFEDRSYRHAFLRRHIPETLAAQIREMREQRHWSQEELGHHANMKQTRISRLEDPDYGSYTLETLTRLAEAFDVSLTVRFSPFSELIDWTTKLTRERLAPPSFKDDLSLGAVILSGWDAVQAGLSGPMSAVSFATGSATVADEYPSLAGLASQPDWASHSMTAVIDAARYRTKQFPIENEGLLYDRVA